MSHGSSLRNCGGTRQDSTGWERRRKLNVSFVIRHSGWVLGVRDGETHTSSLALMSVYQIISSSDGTPTKIMWYDTPL